MANYQTKTTAELTKGDVVHGPGGMRVLLDSEPLDSKSHPAESKVRYCRGLVLNIDEVDDPWLVSMTRELSEWPECKPTGEHRWSIQGASWVRWSVEG